jgi:hypothetical protein
VQGWRRNRRPVTSAGGREFISTRAAGAGMLCPCNIIGHAQPAQEQVAGRADSMNFGFYGAVII